MDNAFKDKDKENLVRLLNFIADKAKFKIGVKEAIEFYGLLSWAQKELLQKIDANIAEVIKVHPPLPAPVPEKRAGKK